MANALDTWFDFLKDRPLPVQAAIALRIQQTLNRAFASHMDFAEILRYGPGMSIEIFRSLRRLKELPKNPIESLPHAVSMLGLEPLQLATLRMPSIERLDKHAVPGLRLCYSRAIQSAYFAQRWAELKHLHHPEAVYLAALVDECAEMALWTNAPQQMLAINRLRAEGLTTDDASTQVLGVPLIRISRKLAEYWNLPPLANESLSHNIYESRALCVVLATNFARTIDTSWVNPKSQLLLELIQEFLDLSKSKTLALVHQQAAEVARGAHFTGLPMAIHHLPFVVESEAAAQPAALSTSASSRQKLRATTQNAPNEQPSASTSSKAPVLAKTQKTAPSDSKTLVEAHTQAQPEQSSATEAEQQTPAAVETPAATTPRPAKTFHQHVEQLLELMQRKIGLQRCLFAELRNDELNAQLAVGDKAEELKATFHHPISGNLFATLTKRPSSLWLNSGNRDRYRPLIPAKAAWSEKDSFMMALFCQGRAVGLFYADNAGDALTEKDFLRFRTTIEKFTQLLEQGQRCPARPPQA